MLWLSSFKAFCYEQLPVVLSHTAVILPDRGSQVYLSPHVFEPGTGATLVPQSPGAEQEGNPATGALFIPLHVPLQAFRNDIGLQRQHQIINHRHKSLFQFQKNQ